MLAFQDYGFLAVGLGATTVGLVLGVIIKKCFTRISRVESRAICLKNETASHRHNINMSGDYADEIDAFEIERIESASREFDLPRLKTSLALTEIGEQTSLEPYYPRAREGTFSNQRKSALEESCMTFEHIIYLLIAIVLASHLVADKPEVEQTTWEIVIGSIQSTWDLIVECGRICMKKLSNLTCSGAY